MIPMLKVQKNQPNSSLTTFQNCLYHLMDTLFYECQEF